MARASRAFAYEWRDDSGHWFRSYGNENWEFDELGMMKARHASINDVVISGSRAAVSVGVGTQTRRSFRFERAGPVDCLI